MNWVILFVLGFFVGCSGLVAPTNEATVAGDTTENGGNTDDDGATDEGATDDVDTDTADEGATDEGATDDGATDTADTGGEGFGTLTAKSGDLEFEPISVYATVNDGDTPSFAITIADYSVTEDMMPKEVESYECVPKEEPVEGPTLKTMSLTLSDGLIDPTTFDNVDDGGMPTKDAYERTVPNAATEGFSFSFYDGTTSINGGKESGDTLTFVTKPAAVGDEFEITIDATFVAGTDADFATPKGTFKVTAKGKTYQAYTYAGTYPTCDADTEQMSPIYKD